MAFHDNFKFSRQSVELLYSVLILLIIPILFAVNTILLTNSVRSDYDLALRNSADAVSQVFGITSIPLLDDQSQTQATIERVVAERDEIVNLAIFIPDESGYQLYAANDFEVEAAVNKDIQFSVVESRHRSIAALVNSPDSSIDKVWNVVSPITSENGELIAITSTDISITDAESVISTTFTRSFIVLAITIFIVVGLLWNHFRFIERVRMVSKLKEADQMKSDFLSVATHELKAPTSVIKGYTSNVMDGMFGEVTDEMKDNLQEVISQADRLTGLVQDLLNVSRIEQGRIKIEPQSMNPFDVVTKIVKRYQKTAQDKGLSISYEPPETTVFILADPGRYEEIMTNLIDNAVKYSEQGSVHVAHQIEKKIIKTTVRDTGIGMSAKDRERLFSRFYRVKNDKTAKISGTGLGLWIIRQYIEKMGGKIYVDSIEGEGTKFTVELPRA